MGLTNEHVGPKILAKIKIYVLTRAEILFQVCYEIPCKYAHCRSFDEMSDANSFMQNCAELDLKS